MPLASLPILPAATFARCQFCLLLSSSIYIPFGFIFLAQAATESQRYSHMYDSWRAAREIRDAVAKTEKMRQSGGGLDAAPPQVSAVAAGGGGGGDGAQPPAQPLTCEAPVKVPTPSTAPSTGSLLRRMLAAFTSSGCAELIDWPSCFAGTLSHMGNPVICNLNIFGTR